MTFSESEVNYLLFDVVNETFASVASVTFKQHTGIPMCGDASSDIAVLTLVTMKYKNISLQHSLDFFLLRYVDDILLINCN